VQDKAGTSPRHHSLVLYGSPVILRLGLNRTTVQPTSVPVL